MTVLERLSVNPIFGDPVKYLFKRKGSDNWYVRLQPPGRQVVEKSLGTSDLKLAEIAAMPLIREHKAFMYQRRPKVTPFWHRAYEPGLRVIDGEQVIATERELQYLDGGGNVIRREPNGGPAELLTPAPQGGPSFKAYDEAKRVPPPVKNADDALLETYLKHHVIDGLRERQARDIWHIFRTVVNKPLKQCTRDDGRAIIAHLEEQAGGGDSERHASPQDGAAGSNCESCHRRRRPTFNPFSGVVPDRDDEDEREAFDDTDMKLIRANLHRLEQKRSASRSSIGDHRHEARRNVRN